MKSSDLIKQVESTGWVLVRVKGSHHQFRHPNHTKPLTIPHPNKDLGKGLVHKIKKQAGL